jgi:hypothetical protein
MTRVCAHVMLNVIVFHDEIGTFVAFFINFSIINRLSYPQLMKITSLPRFLEKRESDITRQVTQ